MQQAGGLWAAGAGAANRIENTYETHYFQSRNNWNELLCIQIAQEIGVFLSLAMQLFQEKLTLGWLHTRLWRVCTGPPSLGF